MTRGPPHNRRSVGTTEGNRQPTVSNEYSGRASDDRTLLMVDGDDGAQGVKDSNRVATIRGKFENPQHGAAPTREYQLGRSTNAETSENRISHENLHAEDGHKPSSESSTPPDLSSNSADHEMRTRATEQLSGKPPSGDDAPAVRYWREKYKTLRDESEADYRKLHTAKDKWKEGYRKAKKDLADEKQLSHNTTQRLQSELQHYKNELEELHTSHIRSVNNVGTGLSPISDQEFQKRIRSLYAEVY